jgi:hypothetical protein
MIRLMGIELLTDLAAYEKAGEQMMLLILC